MTPKSSPKTPQGPDGTANPDNAFMAMCLRNIDPESKKIDMGAVAEALGYKNVKSAGNRFSAIKKKYSIRVEVAYPRTEGAANPKVSPSKIQKSAPKRGRKPKAEAAKEPEPMDNDANVEEDHLDEEDKPNEHEA